jgi:hypothetical protein
MQAKKSLHSNRNTVYQLLDDLLPGDNDWPSASDVLADTSVFLRQLSEVDREWVMVCAETNGDRTLEERLARLSALEGSDGPTFKRVLQALYAAYYTSPAVMARVKELASAGPTEPSRTFDVTLLSRVIQTQAGKRRF